MNMMTCSLLAQAEGGGGGGFIALLVPLFMFVVFLAMLGGMWKTFAKAGKPGWGCIIPVYNLILFCEMTDRPLWWVVLLLIFPISLIAGIIVLIDLATRFGKGAGFGLGLAFLPFIFWPLLGFGEARYQGAAA